MKPEIHPEYVVTTVTCACGNDLRHAVSTEPPASSAPSLLAVPPVLHRQAEDPRHRWPRGAVRGAFRQEAVAAKQQ